MIRLLALFGLAALLAPVLCCQETEPRTVFQVRYVAADGVYIDGGREAGLAEGFHLTIKRKTPGQAEMEARDLGEVTIISIASNFRGVRDQIQDGRFRSGRSGLPLGLPIPRPSECWRPPRNSHKYAQVVSFTEGDPLDEEARKYVPRPPLPEINRLKGMFAVEFTVTDSHNVPAVSSTEEGVVLKTDMTRIGGTYWNFTGLLSRPLEHVRRRPGRTNADGLSQPHLHARPLLQQSRFELADGRRPALHTVGHQPGHDRWRLRRHAG